MQFGTGGFMPECRLCSIVLLQTLCAIKYFRWLKVAARLLRSFFLFVLFCFFFFDECSAIFCDCLQFYKSANPFSKKSQSRRI